MGRVIPAHAFWGWLMSSDFPKMSRTPGRPEAARGKPANGAGLYWLFAGAVLLAAAFGGLVVFLVMRSPVSGGGTTAADNGSRSTNAAPAANSASAGGGQIAWNTVATYGSWQVRCQQQNAKICNALLQVIDNNKRTMMAWIVGPDGKGMLQTVLQTPPGVMVATGIDVKIGTAAVRHVNYISCLSQGCTAAAPMDAVFVKDMTQAAKADVVVYDSNGRSLDLGIPLNGFDKAVAALRR
jgi:invasion protein IalB